MKRRMGRFLFLRAAVGGAALLPAGEAAPALTIDARSARIKTVGGPQGSVWNLWSVGELGDHVRLARAGTYTVTVRARGTPAGGIWPCMAFSTDGTRRRTVTVGSRELKGYEFTIEVGRGVHRIAVGFLNDALLGGEDRNLYIGSIKIEPPQGAPEPALASAGEIKEWGDKLAEFKEKLEKQTLDWAASAIEKNRKGEATVRVTDAKGRPLKGAFVIAEQLRLISTREARDDFLFGCNIYMFDRFKTRHENELYKKRFRELFNYATVGFYWRWYEEVRGRPNYAYTDKVVAWCARHSVRMKGHPLLWAHEAGMPQWAGGRQPAPDLQRRRVSDIMQRYSGKIDLWEVVNEPAHLRSLKIDQPYRWAREADPKAYLIVNDYQVMSDGFPPFFSLLDEARRNGVPFDGIGIQAHEPRTKRFPLDQVRAFLDRYAELGKELHITEFTPTSAGAPIAGSHVEGKWDEAAQADYAAKFYTVCFAHPAVVAITWWDLCDRGSWLEGGGMLRKDLSPKPVYAALKELIHEKWRTRAEGRTDEAGRFTFRGFHGGYIVKVKHEGRAAEAELCLRKGGENIATLVCE